MGRRRKISRAVAISAFPRASLAEELHGLRVAGPQSAEEFHLGDLLTCSSPTLLVLLTSFADFDAFEQAQSIAKRQRALSQRGMRVIVVGIGTTEGGRLFAEKTSLDVGTLYSDERAKVHERIGLYRGFLRHTCLLGLLLMCAGIGSPGTLKEVFRGYCGDLNAEQIFQRGEKISFENSLLPQFDYMAILTVGLGG